MSNSKQRNTTEAPAQPEALVPVTPIAPAELTGAEGGTASPKSRSSLDRTPPVKTAPSVETLASGNKLVTF